MRGRRSLVALALVATLLVSTVGPVLAAGGMVNWASDPAPNVEESVTITKDVHDMQWSSIRMYEADDGSTATLPAELNQSVDNPISFVASDVNFTDARQFPRKSEESGDNVASALDASEWTVGGTNSSELSVTDVTTAPGVDAVEVATGGSFTSGDVAYATYSNFSITSDAEKRYLQAVLDVSTLDSAAHVELRALDSDGDYVNATIDPDRSSGEDYITNATGDGLVYQRQVGKMTVRGTGDGTMSEIQKVRVHVTSGDATVQFAALNAEKMGKWDFGTKKVDTDADDALEEEQHLEVKQGGAISVHALEPLGSAFDSARIHNMDLDMVQTGDDLPDNRVQIDLNTTDTYPGYHGTATIYLRMGFPDAYDLSYANAVLRDTQSVTEDRVISVEYAEGVSTDTAFEDISDTAWSDKTGSYGSEGTEVTLDSTLSPGPSEVVKIKYKLTESQFSAIQASGAAMGPTGGGGGGIVGFLLSLPGLIISGGLGLLGIKMARG